MERAVGVHQEPSRGRSGRADLVAGLCAEQAAARVGAEPPDPAPRARRLQYRIDRESVIRAAQVGEDHRAMPWFRPGVTLVEFGLRDCEGGEAACAREPFEEFQAYLRSRDGRWQVEHWRATGDADQGAQLPEAFAPRAQ